MENQDKEREIEKNLEEMNYSPNEDIFNKEDHISLDEEENSIIDGEIEESMTMDLDVPGSNLDNQQEKIGSEDEENNYYSQSDSDNHEERNDDLIS